MEHRWHWSVWEICIIIISLLSGKRLWVDHLGAVLFLYHIGSRCLLLLSHLYIDPAVWTFINWYVNEHFIINVLALHIWNLILKTLNMLSASNFYSKRLFEQWLSERDLAAYPHQVCWRVLQHRKKKSTDKTEYFSMQFLPSSGPYCSLSENSWILTFLCITLNDFITVNWKGSFKTASQLCMAV